MKDIKNEPEVLKLKELPNNERPREKILAESPLALSNTELLALLLRTGSQNESVLQMAERILHEAGGIAGLARFEIAQLSKIKGIGAAKAATLVGAVELGKRVNKAVAAEKVHIVSPQDVADRFMPRMRYAEKEHFYVLLLSTKNTVIGEVLISVGILNSAVVHAREVFCQAISRAAASIIVVHNHPSGDPAPSKEDVNITVKLVESGKIIGIAVLDHIIIGDNIHYSFKDHGLI